MTGALIVTAVALVVLFLRERAHDTRVDRILGASHSARQEERHEWTRERQTLLNRIKPETAQYVAPDTIHAPEAVSMFSDEDFWQSKDDLAEQAAAEELA
jgi:hypothetical protein